ncbi:redoxin domain-containing protein [Danxiaibacter flavus]|uniref:Redoxin domain-containing protein n=1 Tax=Danxiaibacter flavus TaxID=3049108 RepID=A0ABV3ZEG4_9BACT|nr:redoxin domain-containing protein [Chitinophagaceae bacterium DXS]
MFLVRILLIILFLFIARSVSSQVDSSFLKFRVADFNLQKVQDDQIKMDNRSSLFVFLSPECPLCKGYMKLFDSIYNQYKEHVNIYGVFPGKAYSTSDIQSFASEYSVHIPLYIDSAMSLTHYLNAAVTPEAVLLNDKNELVYKGAIDNLLEGLGKRKIKATAFYLQDALEQSLNNKTVVIKSIKAVGCKINEY